MSEKICKFAFIAALNMKTSKSFSLELLTTYKEDSRLEVKWARGGLPNFLWESYSAFANSEATVNMLANADFYGRRGAVVQKDADGFKFANPDDLIEVSNAQESKGEKRNVRSKCRSNKWECRSKWRECRSKFR